jgi:division protein CdvB (Snf7/Vps24/ESCRT-III family)
VPLRESITKTTYRLNVVQKRVEDSRLRMEHKYKTLFSKCVRAQEAKDSASAIIYANECAQIKKMAQVILTSSVALEQVALRLDTVKDFGDVAVAVMPAVAIVNTLKGRLSGILPEVSMQLGQIGQTLDTLTLEVGQATGQTWSSAPAGEDAERILAEASVIAEQKLREGFPPLAASKPAERGATQA